MHGGCVRKGGGSVRKGGGVVYVCVCKCKMGEMGEGGAIVSLDNPCFKFFNNDKNVNIDIDKFRYFVQKL